MKIKVLNHKSESRSHCNLQFAILLFCSTLLLFSGCVRSLPTQIAQKFQAAQIAFERATTPEEFAKVASLYQEMIDEGAVSARCSTTRVTPG